MRKLALFLLLSSCAVNPMVNHHQCDWRSVLRDPLMNQLMDGTPTSSSQVASVYVQFRGLQKRQQLLQTHICNYDELIVLTRDLVERGVVSAIDLQSIISFQATLKASQFKLQTQLDKLFYELAPLVKVCPSGLASILCADTPLPTPMRCIPCGPCLDILSYFNNEDRVIAFTDAQNASKQSYDMTKDLFERGLKSSVDLIAAHKILIASQDELIQAQVDLLTDYITLYNRY